MEKELFEDKDVGKGCDQMGNKRDGLKLKWRWWTGIPSQVCSAKAGDFTMEVIFWHDTYESRLSYLGNEIISLGHDEDRILTRLEGQKIAEGFLRKHYQYIEKILKKTQL